MSRKVKQFEVGAGADLLSGVDLSALHEQAKLDEVSVSLCALLEHVGISRTDLARKLGWTPSRVTKVLSGDDNLTLKTLVRLLTSLGYDFDVVFRKQGVARARQPWNRKALLLLFDGATAPRADRNRVRDIDKEKYRFSAVLTHSEVCANDESIGTHESVAA